MPFSEILQRSFDVAWRNRSLWIVGMIFAFFGGGSSGGSASGGGGNTGFSGSNTNGDFPMPELPAWLTVEFIVTTAIVLFVVILVLSFISLIIQSIVHAGLIEGTHLAIEDRGVGWRELLKKGWNGRWQSLFGLKILISLPGLILALAAFLYVAVVGFPVLRAVITEDESALRQLDGGLPALFFSGFCILFCLILVVLLVQWVLSVAGHYAARAIVIEGQPLRNGWQQGWQLFRANTLNTLIMSILIAILLGIVGFIVAIPILILAALTIVPLIFAFETLLNTPPPLLVGGGIALAIGFGLLSAVLTGPLLAFSETVWTMTYRHLTGREIPAAPTPVPPTPASV